MNNLRAVLGDKHACISSVQFSHTVMSDSLYSLSLLISTFKEPHMTRNYPTGQFRSRAFWSHSTLQVGFQSSMK